MTNPTKMTRFRRRLGPVLLNTAVVVAVFLAASAFQMRSMLPVSGERAPPLAGPTLTGAHYELADTRADVTLVYFFAPWCTYCSASAGNLVRLRKLRDEHELGMVAVVLDWSSREAVQAYAERHKLNMPVLLGNSQIAADWQVYAFPTYYVVDRAWRVQRRDIGYSTQLGLWWRTRASGARAGPADEQHN